MAIDLGRESEADGVIVFFAFNASFLWRLEQVNQSASCTIPLFIFIFYFAIYYFSFCFSCIYSMQRWRMRVGADPLEQ